MAKIKKEENTETVHEENTEQKVDMKTESEPTSEKPVTGEIPPFVDEILKQKSDYEILYVDHQGGAYTAKTPKCIRGKAILYKNPHYQSK